MSIKNSIQIKLNGHEFEDNIETLSIFKNLIKEDEKLSIKDQKDESNLNLMSNKKTDGTLNASLEKEDTFNFDFDQDLNDINHQFSDIQKVIKKENSLNDKDNLHWTKKMLNRFRFKKNASLAFVRNRKTPFIVISNGINESLHLSLSEFISVKFTPGEEHIEVWANAGDIHHITVKNDEEAYYLIHQINRSLIPFYKRLFKKMWYVLGAFLLLVFINYLSIILGDESKENIASVSPLVTPANENAEDAEQIKSLINQYPALGGQLPPSTLPDSADIDQQSNLDLAKEFGLPDEPFSE